MSIRERLNEKARKEESSGNFFTGVKNGINDFWFPLVGNEKEHIYYVSILGEGIETSEHFDTGLCIDKYYPEDPEGCGSCKKPSKFGPTVKKDKNTGEEKRIEKFEKPVRTYRALAYIHNFAPVNGEPVMIEGKDGKTYPARPLVVIKTQCGEANTNLNLVADRFVKEIKDATARGYLLEEPFAFKTEKVKDGKGGEKVIKPTALLANKRDIMVVKTADQKIHKIEVSKLKVPQEILDEYGPDALTEGEYLGIVFNTCKGVRWGHPEFEGIIKPKALDAEEAEGPVAESDAESACDD